MTLLRTTIVGAVVCALLVVGSPAFAGFPPHLDPKSWELPEHMSWADYDPIPGVDWMDDFNDPPKKLRAALILGDFQDQPFRVAETTVDPTGQAGLGVADPAQYWLDYLFYDENPNSPTHGHTVNEYWLENSYGLVGVEAQAFGPYTMDGNMYEYGIRDFGTGADCPDGPDGCNGDFDTEVTQASLADVTAAQSQYGDFDFRFLLHAGYDESGVWLNYGIDLFKKPEDVTDLFGPADPNHRNWASTRYVEWTSFFAAEQLWSHAIPGVLATEGESDGTSTYAHEFSHILGVLDNYNNPYAEVPDRAYGGPWDMMDRGTFNGPGGPWERNEIPPTKGGVMGTHHMLRNKIRMGFMPASEVLTVTHDVLDAGTIVTAQIQQRESPPAVDDPLMYSGLRVALGGDEHQCDDAKPLCDGGNYDYYDVEVVNRQGFDSFTPDHGVLISKTKTADASPFIWVIDAFPRDIHKVDYVRADGEKFYYTIGDYRQLADATFHAGTAPGTKNYYVDEDNGIALYVLEKKVEEDVLSYTVAARSTEPAVTPAEPEVEFARGKLKRKVSKVVFKVTNPGTSDAIYRLKTKGHGVRKRLLNDIVLIPAGATKKIPVWAKLTGSKGKLTLRAIPL